MVLFANAKINIGLHIVSKRPDGFHNLETIFYPVGLSDIIEINPLKDEKEGVVQFENTGIHLDEAENNLCVKAYRLFNKENKLPGVRIHLHKIIPVGAGLGGGSSDASFVLTGLNELFRCNLPEEELLDMASELGSDCAFFIRNKPAFATGRGNILTPVSLSLNGFYLLLVYPDIHISTAEAYAGIVPKEPVFSLDKIPGTKVKDWREKVKNDFEPGIFEMYPEIEAIREKFYRMGAVYASMSGSGSSVYGIFEEKVEVPGEFVDYRVWGEEF